MMGWVAESATENIGLEESMVVMAWAWDEKNMSSRKFSSDIFKL